MEFIIWRYLVFLHTNVTLSQTCIRLTGIRQNKSKSLQFTKKSKVSTKRQTSSNPISFFVRCEPGAPLTHRILHSAASNYSTCMALTTARNSILWDYGVRSIHDVRTSADPNLSGVHFAAYQQWPILCGTGSSQMSRLKKKRCNLMESRGL